MAKIKKQRLYIHVGHVLESKFTFIFLNKYFAYLHVDICQRPYLEYVQSRVSLGQSQIGRIRVWTLTYVNHFYLHCRFLDYLLHNE